MARSLFFNRRGDPITMEDVAVALRSYRTSQVASDLVDGLVVSTIWVGLNQTPIDDDPPMIFETKVFHANFRGQITNFSEVYCRLYATEAEAIEGHKDIMKMTERHEYIVPSEHPEYDS